LPVLQRVREVAADQVSSRSLQRAQITQVIENTGEPHLPADANMPGQERALGMPVDTPQHRFHNPSRVQNALTGRPKSLERALEEAVSRAVRDNLAPLQRTADELHQAYADLVAACSSTRPSNALPAMLRAQTAASSLAAGLSVLSNFVTVALNSREHHSHDDSAGSDASAAVLD
jgi:hypothetical protein